MGKARAVSRLGVAALLVAMFTGGCTERAAPTSPEAQLQENVIGEITGTLTSILVPVLQRIVPLASDETVTARIGKDGGTVVLRRAGVRVTVPRDAVKATTNFTVTAIKGRDVALLFDPHGITFNRAVTVEVSIDGTVGLLDWLLGSRLYAGYVPRGRAGITNGMAEITETLPTAVDSRQRKAIFSVWHFSGYILATGRARR
ncbi:MAG TPA: hypothetical protein VJ672_17335 [Gemmatimonadaceae bacterium]|nr:hypothetical protein [Gemmatimonadaceae bacterium]